MAMESPGYADKLLNLKDGVWFLFLRDGDNILGKIFYLHSHRKDAKPNKVASMLLYLLARDDGDDIHYETLRNLVEQKFNMDSYEATDKLNAFLASLENCFTGGTIKKLDKTMTYGILEKKDAGSHPGTPVPDPMSLFDGPTMEWETPELNVGQTEPIVNKTHLYARPHHGVNGGTIRR